MTNVKISDLTENTNPSGQEELVYAENWSNWKVKLDTIKNFVDSSGKYQEKKYKTDDFVSPTAMVELWDSKIKIVYTYSWSWYSILAEFTPWESNVDIYLRQNSSSDYIKVHTFNPGFAPLWWVWYQNFFTVTNPNPKPDSDLLVLWNRDHIATFTSPRNSDLTLHFSTEHRVSVVDAGNIDFSVPVYSMFDISMIDPSVLQENSVWFSWIFYQFNRILLQWDSGYMNYWNWAPSAGVNSDLVWLSPEPGTIAQISLEFVKYQYVTIDNICPVPLQTSRYTWIVRDNTVQKVEVTWEFEIWQVLAETNINLWWQITFWTFNESWWTAWWKERAPIDTSLFYLWYGFSNKFITKNDSTVLKTTNIINGYNPSPDSSEKIYNAQTVNDMVEWAKVNIIWTDWRYHYNTNADWWVNPYDICLFKWTYLEWWQRKQCIFASSQSENTYILLYHNEWDGSDNTYLDQYGNTIYITSQNWENLVSLWLSEDWTKIMYTTESNKFGYYELPAPYDFEHINWVTYEASFESVITAAWYNINGCNNFVTPDWQYLYVQDSSSYNKFELSTPFDVSTVTFVENTWILYDYTSITRKTSLWYSLDWMCFHIDWRIYLLDEKYNLTWKRPAIYLNTSYNRPTSPMLECIVMWQNTHTSPNPETSAVSWNWAINAVVEKNEPKNAVEKIERVATPFVLTPTDSNNLWSTTYNANLWWSTTNTLVARRWPCPEWYHIPSLTEWNNATTIISNITGSGVNVEEMVRYCLMLPLGWVLSWYTDRAWQTGWQKAYVWDRALYLSSDSSYESMSDIYYASWYLLMDNGTSSSTWLTICNWWFIRPFKNVSVAPDSSWTTRYDGGANGFAAWSWAFVNYDLWLISISSDWTNWVTMANKNLGAATYYDTASYPDCTQENSWNFYQWWNNYGFPYAGTTDTTTELVDVTGYGPDNYYWSWEILSITLSDFVTHYQTPSDDYLICAGNNLKPGTEYKLIIDNNSNNKVWTIDNDTIVDMFGINATIDNEAQIITFIALDDSTLCVKEVQGTANEALVDVAKAFIPVTDTTSTDELVVTNLTTVFTPTEDFTLSCWSVLPWMSYIVRLTSWATAYTMTLNANVTNPYNETLTLTASKTTTIVLLATSSTELEIQSIRTATSSSPR